MKLINNKPQKIAIIGISASGKTTVSKQVSEIFHLPLFHIDQLMYKENWNLRPEQEYNNLHRNLLATQDKWVIEGYVYEKMIDRLQQADIILYLDYSGIRNVWQYIRRYFELRISGRTELGGTKERFYFRIFKRIFNKGKEWRAIEKTLKRVENSSKIVRIKSPRDLTRYIQYYKTLN